jgi:hypothetical protein
MSNIKKLLLLPTLSMSLFAGGTLAAKQVPNNMFENNESVITQERTWYQVAMLKPETPLSDDELRNRVIYTNIIGAAVVTAWGVGFWDYFTVNPRLGDEGWFGKDTKYGGADKFGHMYSTYLWSLGFQSLYEYWGMQEDDALIYGPLTSWVFQGLMEVGDSFSETEGFSYEDLIMNTVGAGFYYIREKYPEVKRKVDFRLEYIPDFNADVDFFTQYNSMKYMFALKFSGFDDLEDTAMKYFELQLGYYTRGYSEHENYHEEDKERVTYIGIGINTSEVLKAMGWEKTSKIFNYYQLPYTYVPFSYDFDTQGYVQPYSRPYHGTKK